MTPKNPEKSLKPGKVFQKKVKDGKIEGRSNFLGFVVSSMQ
jgi:hypothetical protein